MRFSVCLLLLRGCSESDLACSTCSFVRVSCSCMAPRKRACVACAGRSMLFLCSVAFMPLLSFRQGVCASCRKVVVLRSLEDPSKGAAVCLALLSDPALLQSTLELDEKEDAEELEAIRGQITFMLDAYFDKST